MSTEQYIAIYQKTPRESMLLQLHRMPLTSPHWILQIERDAMDALVVEGIAERKDGCWIRGEKFIREEQ